MSTSCARPQAHDWLPSGNVVTFWSVPMATVLRRANVVGGAVCVWRTWTLNSQ